MVRSTTAAGRLGETSAIQLLQKNGYKVINRNFRTRFGEIDIIALDHSGNLETLVFVEVKTRWNQNYGYPEEAVTPRKIRSIIRAGEYYKLTHSQTPDLLRVDVVAIEVENDKVVSVKLIKNITG